MVSPSPSLSLNFLDFTPRSLWIVVLNLGNSFQISIILFPFPFCVGLLSSTVHFLLWCLWFECLLSLSFGFLKKNSKHLEDTDESSILAIEEVTADRNTQTCCLVPTLNYFSMSFFSWVVYWGYTRPSGCFFICSPDKDMMKYPYCKRTLKGITKMNVDRKFIKFLSKVGYLFPLYVITETTKFWSILWIFLYRDFGSAF